MLILSIIFYSFVNEYEYYNAYSFFISVPTLREFFKINRQIPPSYRFQDEAVSKQAF